eukprot:191356_1
MLSREYHQTNDEGVNNALATDLPDGKDTLTLRNIDIPEISDDDAEALLSVSDVSVGSVCNPRMITADDLRVEICGEGCPCTKHEETEGWTRHNQMVGESERSTPVANDSSYRPGNDEPVRQDFHEKIQFILEDSNVRDSILEGLRKLSDLQRKNEELKDKIRTRMVDHVASNISLTQRISSQKMLISRLSEAATLAVGLVRSIHSEISKMTREHLSAANKELSLTARALTEYLSARLRAADCALRRVSRECTRKARDCEEAKAEAHILRVRLRNTESELTALRADN